ncbi:bypass of stop codon 6 [Fusarium denticulatum]|uniref:Bypass of stop codon 6 n=1 Tax=Fusarium denticulatum TaxID=48507 RepID=A0A8H5X5B9_9HYPO|nr:bypass of stop codon 6 [Fusarium denticulatum]
MDWFPSKTDPKKIPKICIDEEDFHREDFYCNVCDEDLEKDYGTCEGGTQRMGILLERFIKHIKAHRRITKEAYDSNPKTIRLRKKASRAIASYSNKPAADSIKDHRAEHERTVATNTLSCLIDINNSLRVIAQCTLHTSGLAAGTPDLLEMPRRCGPEKMPDECVWDEDDDKDEEQ